MHLLDTEVFLKRSHIILQNTSLILPLLGNYVVCMLLWLLGTTTTAR